MEINITFFFLRHHYKYISHLYYKLNLSRLSSVFLCHYYSNSIVVFFQMLDMISPKLEGKISLSDLKACRMTNIFFDTFFNLEKYLEHEQKDPFASVSYTFQIHVA